MKIVEQSYEIIKQQEGIENLYKHIELCGRVCYKSEKNITESSNKEFVEKLLKLRHYSVLEHGSVYLSIPFKNISKSERELLIHNPYSKTYITKEGVFNTNKTLHVSTNFRVIFENNLKDLLLYLVPFNKDVHYKRTTVKFITNRAIANEIVRHRVFSYSQESTRYCNYSKDRFDSGVTYIKDSLLNLDNPEVKSWYYTELFNAEFNYFKLVNECNIPPQLARNLLPLNLKTELIMTGFNSDWEYFINMRTANNAHPEIRNLLSGIKCDIGL